MNNTKPMRVILLGFQGRDGVMEAVERLRPAIEAVAEVVASDFTGTEDMSTVEADLAIVFGGDGSILRSAHQMGDNQLPVLAVNLGRLGFLANVSPAELPQLIASLEVGNLRIVRHLMIACELLRAGQVLLRRVGLNEVCVQTGPPYSIMEIDLYVDSEHVTTYSCDGLIISTPVGSTAHSLSAGGPILRKDLQAIVISPISPHTLSNRPVVDSADRTYELAVGLPKPGTPLILDGTEIATLEPGDRVRIRRAEAEFQMIEAPGHSYYRTLREKLGWGGRLHYGQEEK